MGMNNTSNTAPETLAPNYVFTAARMARIVPGPSRSWTVNAIGAMFQAALKAGHTLEGTVEFGFTSNLMADETVGFIVKGRDAARMATYLAAWCLKHKGLSTVLDTRSTRRHAVHAGAVFLALV